MLAILLEISFMIFAISTGEDNELSGFERAMALAPSCEYFTTAGGRTLEQIQKAEKKCSV